MASRLVSIGLPVYNGGEQLRAAIETLLFQTHTNFELIISDNASTDEITKSLTEEYARKDSRIRLFRQPTNRPVAENFLFVLDQAQGDYFFWAAHDDTRSNNFVEVLARRLDECPDAVLATPRTQVSTTRISGETCITSTAPAPNADRWKTLDAFVKDCPCVWIYGIYNTSWLKVAAQDLKQYHFSSSDMIWLFDLLLRAQVVGDDDATFFYNVVHGTRKRRTSRQKFDMLATEIYHLTRLVNLRLPATARYRAMGKVLELLNRHRISRRNPIGTSVHLAKLAALGTWFGLETGVRKLFKLRPAA